MNNRYLPIVFAFIVYNLSFIVLNAQQHKIDSLTTVLKNQKEDTNKVKNLDNLAFLLHIMNPDTAILIAQQAIDLATKLDWKKGEATTYNDLGLGYWVKGNYPKALEYYLKALKINEETGDKHGQAVNLANIANIYDDQSDYSKALDYDLKALKINEEIGRKQGQAINLGNIGNIYGERADFSKALDYYQKALKLDDELRDRRGQAYNLGNIGLIYFDRGDFLKALDYYLKSSKICEEIQDKQRQAINFGNIGLLYTKTGKFKEAEIYLKKAIVLDSSISDKNDLRQNEEGMSRLYDTIGQYKQALYWYKKATILKDTLFNIDKNKALTRKELTFKFQRQADSAKAEQAQKDILTAATEKKQQVISWSVGVGLMLVLVFAGFVVRALRTTQKQKQIIEVKNKEVEEKNKDILDSIHYAQRIQKALLASDNLLKQNLPEYFVLFKPKDIVSGDFYWATKQNNRFYIAVCDSTGHGVPGAFMSLLNISYLNEAISEKNLVHPNEVFNHARKRLIDNISQEGQQDGMDGILVSTETGKEIMWAAAHNPPIIARNNELIELAADKLPVGKSPMDTIPFTHYSIKVEKGDILYLFTDGYADQFGGPKGKKFKYRQLQEKLVTISSFSMAEQKRILEETLEKWKGSLEQVDDILVIGIRV